MKTTKRIITIKHPPPHLSDEFIRELLCLDEWQQLQEQMRAYAKKVM